MPQERSDLVALEELGRSSERGRKVTHETEERMNIAIIKQTPKNFDQLASTL